MPQGKLQMWNGDRGFGFVSNDAGGPDRYLHISALEKAGIDPGTIQIGTPFYYEVVTHSDGKTEAVDIQLA